MITHNHRLSGIPGGLQFEISTKILQIHVLFERMFCNFDPLRLSTDPTAGVTPHESILELRARPLICHLLTEADPAACSPSSED
jgi:hypothetical protein